MLTIIYSTKCKIIEVSIQVGHIQITNCKSVIIVVGIFFGILCSTPVSWITATPKLFLIRLVFTSSRVGVVRGLWTQWKLKNQTLKNQIPLITPLFMIKRKAHSLSCKQKCKNQPMTIPVLNLKNLPFPLLIVNNRVASGIGTVICFRFHWFWFSLDCMTLVVK